MSRNNEQNKNMVKYSAQRVRDPLHDLIVFEASDFDNALWDVVQTPPFQRLRRVKQLGFSELVYPGATHTRFAHSIGVFHTAKLLMANIETELRRSGGFEETKAKEALAAALVHDVGHGPFSHSFETVADELELPNVKHEKISGTLIRDSEISEALAVLGSGFPNDVASLIENDGATNIYSSVVSSQFDADRLDYMRRDKLMTGTQHSEIDFTWLVQNLRIGRLKDGVDEQEVGEVETLVLDSKAIYAAEAYVLGLFQLYPTIYFHKATRSAEKIFSQLLLRLNRLVVDGGISKTGLPKSHPLVKFFRKPSEIQNFLELDDAVVWGALSMMAHARDEILSELANRLRNRNLLKACDLNVELRTILKDKVDPSELEEAVERAALLALDFAEEWNEEQKDEYPRLIIDKAKRSPYRKTQSDSSVLNQMLIETPAGYQDLSEVSDVVRAAREYKLRRLYSDEYDKAAKNQIQSCIDRAVKEEVNAA